MCSSDLIRLKQFNATAAKDMAAAVKELEGKGVQGYVLDLRSNPGGLLMASIAIARQWLDEGVIVSTKTRDGIQDIKRATGHALIANDLLGFINRTYGKNFRLVDLAATVRDDPTTKFERAREDGPGLFGSGDNEASDGASVAASEQP